MFVTEDAADAKPHKVAVVGNEEGSKYQGDVITTEGIGKEIFLKCQ